MTEDNFNYYVTTELQDAYPHKLKQLSNVMWGLEQYGKIEWLSKILFRTEIDIEAMLDDDD